MRTTITTIISIPSTRLIIVCIVTNTISYPGRLSITNSSRSTTAHTCIESKRCRIFIDIITLKTWLTIIICIKTPFIISLWICLKWLYYCFLIHSIFWAEPSQAEPIWAKPSLANRSQVNEQILKSIDFRFLAS